MHEPCEANDWHVAHVELLSQSLLHWTGCGLIEECDAVTAARQLYFAPFALLSHGTEVDPVINYANKTAQELFEMEWSAFVQLPSRLSAQAVVQSERDALLKRVTEHGFIDDYTGVRVSSTGRLFCIDHATVWNLLNTQGEYDGQAAMFSIWQHL
ncbi:MEKHLA domain protein [Mariprofundus micogutta]|uniref:MEKHLA domain protein n=2 Tax=Mariprofundus micogutta TaxID=1921010 RepID=A0A1L8CNG9_9PROT|nr:MEKHLA domain protein [Mariprofundus micogutta]